MRYLTVTIFAFGVCGLSEPVLADAQNSSSNYVLPRDIISDESRVCGAPECSPKAPHSHSAENTPAAPVPAETDSHANAIEISLPLIFDEVYFGDISVRILGERYWLPWDRFNSLVSEEITPELIQELENNIHDGYLEVGDINSESISILYNPELLQIEIATHSEARQTEIINFKARLQREKIEYLDPEKFSIFVNSFISTQYDWSGGEGGQNNFKPRGTIDIGGRIGGQKGVAFLSGFNFDGFDRFNIQRNDTLLVYDINSKLSRISLGDIQPRAAHLQSVPSVVGISIERFFDIDPTHFFQPKFETNLQLDRPSNVEIRRNGITLRDLDLRAGRYDLRDLSLSQGSNLIELVITDDLGEESIISQQNYFDFDLLEKGIWDYSLVAGFRSTFSQDGLEYSNDPVASGFLRTGLTKSFSLGADLQGDKSGANGGISYLWALPFGVIDGGFSASQYDVFGLGYSSSLGYTARGHFGKSNDLNWSVNLDGQYTSERFSTLPTTATELSLIPEEDFNTAQNVKLNLNGGAQISKKRWSFTSSLNYLQSYGEARDVYGLTAGINYRFLSDFNIGIFGSHNRNITNKETGGLVRLSWKPSRKTLVNARYDSIRNQAELSYRNASENNVGALSYNLTTVSNLDTNIHSIRADGNYIGNRFEALTQHEVTSTPGSNTLEQTSRASIRSSLAFVDGAFAIGRPVRETFAIVEKHPSLSGKKLTINPNDQSYSAATDAFGHALATQINSYSPSSVAFDVEDLPLGYNLDSGKFDIKPPLNAGYKVQVGTESSYTLIGYLKDGETGEALALLGGRLESLDNPDADPVTAFTNRNGRLAATGLMAGRYQLILYTDPNFTYEITIPDSDQSLVDIGELLVTASD